ncbi:helix-turn-helix transcriptional regulator [Actinoplanes sp. NBC_00393]|uniref:helix-turn-helix transcriptional regulator n=1 Tax=Actinoplanes sp. NBC_00393 TaxID=2975953 RepID=UPI002E249B51
MREMAWPLLGMAAAALTGTVIGLIAIPPAAPAVLAMTAAQLGTTALAVVAPRRPVLWAVAVAAVSLGSTLLDDRLADLAHSGAVPWIALSTAVAALVLYRHAKDQAAVVAGTVALALGSIGVVAVSVQAGVPVATAILAAGVPFLIGVIMALLQHLRDAREDRVRRPELVVDDRGDGSLAGARRALAIVALRSDELAASAADGAARRAAADLRDVARRGLTGADGGSVARIEVHPAGIVSEKAGAAATGERTRETSMPELPDREREILRLVATGASNAAIARSLYLSEATVKQYVSRLMRRFDRENRTQLALLAAQWFDGFA